MGRGSGGGQDRVALGTGAAADKERGRERGGEGRPGSARTYNYLICPL